MKTITIALLALMLLPLSANADTAALPWTASAQAPTAFNIPSSEAAGVMAEAYTLVSTWKTRDSRMYPMPIRLHTDRLIETWDPTALGLFGVTITDEPTMGVDLIAVNTSAYEGKAFLISQQHKDSSKRGHLIAYLLEQFAGVPTAPTAAPMANPVPVPTPAVSPTPAIAPSASPVASPTSVPSDPPFQPSLNQLQIQLNSGQYQAALATLDALRAAINAKLNK